MISLTHKGLKDESLETKPTKNRDEENDAALIPVVQEEEEEEIDLQQKLIMKTILLQQNIEKMKYILLRINLLIFN